MADTPTTPEGRLTLLEQLATQQLRVNDQLIEMTARLNQEQALHAARLAQHEAILASLAQTLAAIKDMLERGNGH
jgi:hypothetical protein